MTMWTWLPQQQHQLELGPGGYEGESPSRGTGAHTGAGGETDRQDRARVTRTRETRAPSPTSGGDRSWGMSPGQIGLAQRGRVGGLLSHTTARALAEKEEDKLAAQAAAAEELGTIGAIGAGLLGLATGGIGFAGTAASAGQTVGGYLGRPGKPEVPGMLHSYYDRATTSKGFGLPGDTLTPGGAIPGGQPGAQPAQQEQVNLSPTGIPVVDFFLTGGITGHIMRSIFGPGKPGDYKPGEGGEKAETAPKVAAAPKKEETEEKKDVVPTAPPPAVGPRSDVPGLTPTPWWLAGG